MEQVSVELPTEVAVVDAPIETETVRRELARLGAIVSAGWLGTNLGIAVADLPLKFLLKDHLHLTAPKIAGFFALGAISNYFKPLAGVLTDSVPLFGTRRRAYLLLSLLGSGIGWLALSWVPRTYNALLLTYALLYVTIVFTSTTLGGVMVEIGQRFHAEGRLTAQRIAMFRLGSLGGGPIGGALAYYPFGFAMAVAAGLHLVLVPLYMKNLPEPRTARTPTKEAFRNATRDAAAQFRTLARSSTLLSAAGMICLIAASPGFGTPLLFHQTDTLHFTKGFIGVLVLIAAAFGLIGATFYYKACRNLPLRTLLGGSVLVHALGTLFYLGYHNHATAIFITALSGITGTLAMLPVYDLAARATPRGSEAIGYSVMMSVWNLTNALSDWSGSWLYQHFHLTFLNLVWLNAGTTVLVLFAIPLLPAALLARKDGARAA